MSDGSTVTLRPGDPLVAALADLLIPVVRAEAQSAAAAAQSPWLTVKEAAEYLRCNRNRIDKLTSKGVLQRYREGGRVLLRRDELDAFVRAGGATT